MKNLIIALWVVLLIISGCGYDDPFWMDNITVEFIGVSRTPQWDHMGHSRSGRNGWAYSFTYKVIDSGDNWRYPTGKIFTNVNIIGTDFDYDYVMKSYLPKIGKIIHVKKGGCPLIYYLDGGCGY